MDPFASKRMELLSHVPGLRSPECRLNVVDTAITLEERIAAWEMAGGQASDLEGFRAECALTVRSPSKGDPAKVTTLDLENANLRHVDLSQYVNLKHLT